jgi:hypothetical protein
VFNSLLLLFLHAHPNKWQNNQRIDGSHILVEVVVNCVKALRLSLYGFNHTVLKAKY